eukprot:848952-Prorocentrum_minimum.AAC.1
MGGAQKPKTLTTNVVNIQDSQEQAPCAAYSVSRGGPEGVVRGGSEGGQEGVRRGSEGGQEGVQKRTTNMLTWVDRTVVRVTILWFITYLNTPETTFGPNLTPRPYKPGYNSMSVLKRIGALTHLRASNVLSNRHLKR